MLSSFPLPRTHTCKNIPSDNFVRFIINFALPTIIINHFQIQSASGTAGDSLFTHNGKPFSTRDQDNDGQERHCARVFHGAWWFEDCMRSNLNGMYHHTNPTPYGTGVHWARFKGRKYSLKRTEMKMRPVDF